MSSFKDVDRNVSCMWATSNLNASCDNIKIDGGKLVGMIGKHLVSVVDRGQALVDLDVEGHCKNNCSETATKEPE